MAFSIPQKNKDYDYWTNAVASKNMDKRIDEFRTLGNPIFTYDELDNELHIALKKISELEAKIFKLQYENEQLKKQIEITTEISKKITDSITYHQ